MFDSKLKHSKISDAQNFYFLFDRQTEKTFGLRIFTVTFITITERLVQVNGYFKGFRADLLKTSVKKSSKCTFQARNVNLWVGLMFERSF
jgi:hypothetical protein